MAEFQSALRHLYSRVVGVATVVIVVAVIVVVIIVPVIVVVTVVVVYTPCLGVISYLISLIHLKKKTTKQKNN